MLLKKLSLALFAAMSAGLLVGGDRASGQSPPIQSESTIVLPNNNGAIEQPKYKLWTKKKTEAKWAYQFSFDNLADARSSRNSYRTDGLDARITYNNQVVE